MKRLIILSDINGLFLPEQGASSPQLSGQFDSVEELDTNVLGEVESFKDQGSRHQAFITGGIDKAVEKLIQRYPDGIRLAVGLSVGGTVLWRAAQKGLSIGTLLCFSSTRLRFESQAPSCNTVLYYGSDDPYRPPQEWFSNLGLTLNLVSGAGHDFYRTPESVKIFNHELKKLV